MVGAKPGEPWIYRVIASRNSELEHVCKSVNSFLRERQGAAIKTE